MKHPLAILDQIQNRLNDNTCFFRKKNTHEFVLTVSALSPLIDTEVNFCNTLDRLLSTGLQYKHDGTSTVAASSFNHHNWVIKRYNPTSIFYGLKILITGSRAAKAFREALALKALGIETPTPLLYAIRYKNGIPGSNYIVTEKAEGATLHDLLLDGTLDRRQWPTVVEKVRALVKTLHQHNITHGDIKPTNLMFDGEKLEIIDLDSLRFHTSKRSFAYHQKKDLAAVENRIDMDPETYVSYKKRVLGLD